MTDSMSETTNLLKPLTADSRIVLVLAGISFFPIAVAVLWFGAVSEQLSGI